MHNYMYHAIDAAIDKIERHNEVSTTYVDLAKAVAKLLKEEYGTHNIEPFMKALNDELKKG